MRIRTVAHLAGKCSQMRIEGRLSARRGRTVGPHRDSVDEDQLAHPTALIHHSRAQLTRNVVHGTEIR
jgi:hypothetical protein